MLFFLKTIVLLIENYFHEKILYYFIEIIQKFGICNKKRRLH
jgi:hypothetical protein